MAPSRLATARRTASRGRSASGISRRPGASPSHSPPARGVGSASPPSPVPSPSLSSDRGVDSTLGIASQITLLHSMAVDAQPHPLGASTCPDTVVDSGVDVVSSSSLEELVAVCDYAHGSPSPARPETARDWERRASLDDLPNEVMMHILGFLDVSDLLATSRTSHHLRTLSLSPILHVLRLREARHLLPPLLHSPRRPSLADLIARSIFLTRTTVLSRQLGRSLVSIRLSRRLAARPPAEVLVERAVLPAECAPGIGHVAPALVAKKRAVEKERVKDGLRRWVGAVWRGEVRERSEGVKVWEERVGVGRVWRLRRFWERVGREGEMAV